MRPKELDELLCSRLAVDRVAIEFLKPVFRPEKRVEIESKAGIDPLRLDIDGPELIRLPANVQIVEGNDGDLIPAGRFLRFKRPQAMLAVDHFNRG
jgi:hypothetical protein